MFHSAPFMPRPLLLVLTVALTLAACGPKSDGGSAADGERPTGTKIGFQAPDFAIPRLGAEGEMTLAELKGKVVVLSFWASWCGPCRVEIPALEEAWQRSKEKDVVIVGISIDDTSSEASRFLAGFPVTYPMLFDAAGDRVANPWKVMSLPTTIVLDKAGVVRLRHIGYTPQQLKDTLTIVDQLLEE